MGVRQGQAVYETLVFEEDPLKTLFKAIKSSTSDSMFDRIFITGVSPVVMSDLTSGYNIAENIYTKARFNDVCGFTDTEMRDALHHVERARNLDAATVETALTLMQTYYNRHLFTIEAARSMYNPTLTLYFLKNLYEDGTFPRQMLDMNLETDDAKLHYIASKGSG